MCIVNIFLSWLLVFLTVPFEKHLEVLIKYHSPISILWFIFGVIAKKYFPLTKEKNATMLSFQSIILLAFIFM